MCRAPPACRVTRTLTTSVNGSGDRVGRDRRRSAGLRTDQLQGRVRIICQRRRRRRCTRICGLSLEAGPLQQRFGLHEQVGAIAGGACRVGHDAGASPHPSRSCIPGLRDGDHRTAIPRRHGLVDPERPVRAVLVPAYRRRGKAERIGRVEHRFPLSIALAPMTRSSARIAEPVPECRCCRRRKSEAGKPLQPRSNAPHCG